METYNPEIEVVRMQNITKKFGSFTANDNIDISVHKGEVLALLGENGAGKSTLMNILYGLYSPTSGKILINGKECKIASPKVAIENGIGMVHQHFMLVKSFSVAENIILGMEPTGLFGKLDRKKAYDEVQALSEKYGLSVDPNAIIQDITVGMEQRVEILKLLYRGADILILDEPTAVLTPQEIKDLMSIIQNLSKAGKSIILISHKLNEIKQAADNCAIIRRGKLIDTVRVKDTSIDELASKMVGRKVNFKVSKEEREPGDTVLEVKELVVKDNRNLNAVNGLSFTVNSGEIFGIAGVDGNGQSEFLEALTGLRPVESGSIVKSGKEISNKSPLEIKKEGVANIPEDRQRRGLILDFSVCENMILGSQNEYPFSARGILQRSKILHFAKELIQKFDIRPTDAGKITRNLSGGNQQKVIIAREVTNNPDLLISAQPTRGLDVGSIEFVHKSLVSQRDKGKAVLLISLELDEILNVCDRIGVIHRGQIVGIVDGKNADIDEIGLMMAGGRPHERDS